MMRLLSGELRVILSGYGISLTGLDNYATGLLRATTDVPYW